MPILQNIFSEMGEWGCPPPQMIKKSKLCAFKNIFIKCKVQNNFLKVSKVAKVPIWEGPMNHKKVWNLGLWGPS